MHIYLSVPSVAFAHRGEDGVVIDTDLYATYQCIGLVTDAQEIRIIVRTNTNKRVNKLTGNANVS